jgi:hypothetical protein
MADRRNSASRQGSVRGAIIDAVPCRRLITDTVVPAACLQYTVASEWIPWVNCRQNADQRGIFQPVYQLRALGRQLAFTGLLQPWQVVPSNHRIRMRKSNQYSWWHREAPVATSEVRPQSAVCHLYSDELPDAAAACPPKSLTETNAAHVPQKIDDNQYGWSNCNQQ